MAPGLARRIDTRKSKVRTGRSMSWKVIKSGWNRTKSPICVPKGRILLLLAMNKAPLPLAPNARLRAKEIVRFAKS